MFTSRSQRHDGVVTDVSDTGQDANTVYAIDRAFWLGRAAHSTSNSLGLVGRLDLETGNLTPVMTDLKNPPGHGVRADSRR
jgi:hypothetical protein